MNNLPSTLEASRRPSATYSCRVLPANCGSRSFGYPNNQRPLRALAVKQRLASDHRQQSRRACRGGQVTSPHEQNTQQSPGLGFNTAPQAGQSQKYWQASVGMRARVGEPHSGQVIVLSNRKAGACLPCSTALGAPEAKLQPATPVVSGTVPCFLRPVIALQLRVTEVRRHWVDNDGGRG